jgi:AAHS family 4-hydroxybenzoate transporter-like MFS transporter
MSALLSTSADVPEGPWTAYQKWLVCLTAITIMFDGMDNQLLGITIPALIADWHVPRTAFAPVVSLGFLGMIIGSAAAGYAGDRIGRRTALLTSIAVFGVCTLAIGFVNGVTALGALRFVTGIGLGGAMPNATALAAEYVPRNRRALAVTITIVCVPLGGVIAGLAAIRVLPLLGWRGMFMTGGVLPIVASVVLSRLLPESPRFVAERAARTASGSSGATTRGATVADLFAPEFRRDTIALWVAFFSCLLCVYLAFSWLPSIITGAGLSPSVASTGITVFNLGGVFGALCGGALITRFGSRVTMLPMAAGAVLGAVVLSRMPLHPGMDVFRLLATLAFTGGLINAVQTMMFALAAHVYPTAMRATGVGTGSSFGRIGAVLTGYAGPWALAYAGSASFFALMGAAIFVTLIALACVRRHIE